MGSHDSGEEFGQPGASFGAQVLQEFHMDVVVTWGFVFCTSSVNAMLTRLKSEPLASRWRAARLLMFYKIHYGLVATPMLLRHQVASCTHVVRKLSGLPHPTVIV